MATQEQMILEEMQRIGQPISRVDLAKAISKAYEVKTRSQQLYSPLSKLRATNKVWQDQEGLYHLGPMPGHTPPVIEPAQAASRTAPETAPQETPAEASSAPPPLGRATMEGVHASMYEQFKDVGKLLGVSDELVQVTTDYVFQGGDYKDVAWVWEALTQMHIRPDFRDRWWHSWRSRLGQPLPASAPGYPYGAYPYSQPGVAAQPRPDIKPVIKDYIIQDDIPVRVTEGTGDFSFEEAERVLSIKARAKAAPAPQAQPMTLHDVKELVQLLQGKESAGKHYVITPTAEGTVVQEVAAGQPVIVGTNTPPPPSTKIVDRDTGQVFEAPAGEPIILASRQPEAPPTLVVGPDGQAQEVPHGKPIIIHQPPPPTSPQAATWIVNPVDGTKTKVEPGEPIIIQSAPVRQDGTVPMIMQMRDEHGNPLQMDIHSLLALRKFEGEEKRETEKHQALLATLSQIRKEIPVAVKAYAATANQRARTQIPESSGEPVASPPPEQILVCPNAACGKPINIAGMPPGDGECPYCHERFTLQFEGPQPPEEAAG